METAKMCRIHSSLLAAIALVPQSECATVSERREVHVKSSVANLFEWPKYHKEFDIELLERKGDKNA